MAFIFIPHLGKVLFSHKGFKSLQISHWDLWVSQSSWYKMLEVKTYFAIYRAL